MLKAIIFDVDGVLLDSFESNLRFIQGLMRTFKYSVPTAADYKRLFHLPLYSVLKAWAKIDDEAKIKEILAAREHLEPDRTVKMPLDASNVLTQLKKRYKLGLVTARLHFSMFEGELASHKPLFDVAVGYEDTVKHKPSPEPLLFAINKLGLTPEECVYIGDAVTDIQAGHAAGIRVIFYGNERPKGAAGYAKNFKEIPRAIVLLSS